MSGKSDFQLSIALDYGLYALVKRCKGYYCFLHRETNGNLTILHGGVRKRLPVADVKYCYDNMIAVINHIKQPLDQFSNYQKQIADAVKKIGGDGKIHGAIVDIDFFNHFYVNPVDGSITGYYAIDMVYKEVYPSVPKLLEVKRPDLYKNYVKLIAGSSKTEIAIPDGTVSNMPVQIYLSTDIYKASREIKKMQRLYSNILTIWHEPKPEQPMLE